jgi:hypothetical protein
MQPIMAVALLRRALARPRLEAAPAAVQVALAAAPAAERVERKTLYPLRFLFFLASSYYLSLTLCHSRIHMNEH